VSASVRKARFAVPSLGELLAVAGRGDALLLLAPPAGRRGLALAVAVPVLAWVGRPGGQADPDRVLDGPRFTRLTAEMVRKALVDISVPGIKEPASCSSRRRGSTGKGRAGWPG
jgi:hypothetical protein